MVKSALRSAFLPALLACAAALFSPSTASAQLKVGIVNFQRAVLGTSEMKKASNELLAKYKPQQDQLEKLQKELTDIQARLQDPKTPAAVGVCRGLAFSVHCLRAVEGRDSQLPAS